MIKWFCLGIWIFLSCGEEESFPREDFEDHWWEIDAYPICFNFHNTGELLLYEERINSVGEWDFCEPNEYTVDDETIAVTIAEDCWRITGLDQDLTACECTLR